MNNAFRSLLLITGLGGLFIVHADDDEAGLLDADPDHWYYAFYFGDLQSDINAVGLVNPRAQIVLGAELWKQVPADIVSIGFDFKILSRQYDTPPDISGGLFTRVDDTMDLSTLGVSALARMRQRFGAFEAGVGASVGMYLSNLRLTASTLGLPGEAEEKSSSIGYEFLFSIAYGDDDGRYGLEYRSLSLDGNFAPVTSSRVDIGGEMLLLRYSEAF